MFASPAQGRRERLKEDDMFPFPLKPDTDWYEKTWWTPDQPKRARRVTPALVGAICVLLALASVTVLQPAPSGLTTVEMG